MWFVYLLLGVVLSVALAVYAITKRSWRWMLVSCAFYLPFAGLMSMTIRFDGAYLVPLLHLAAAIALWKGRRVMASLLLLPIILFTGLSLM